MKEKYFDVIVDCDLQIASYTDVSLKLNDRVYCSYKKRSQETNYSQIRSNNSLPMNKDLLRSIKKWLWAWLGTCWLRIKPTSRT